MLDRRPQISSQRQFEFALDQVSDGIRWPALAEYENWLPTHRVFAANGCGITGLGVSGSQQALRSESVAAPFKGAMNEIDKSWLK